MEKTSIMEVGFNNISLNEAVNMTLNHISNKNKGYVVTPNAEIAYMCKNDAKLLEIVNKSFLTLPDGIGVVYASKILGKRISQKVAGIEYGEKLIEASQNKGFKIFFLGGKPSVAQLAAQNMVKKYPNVNIAGVCDGYFEKPSDVIDIINNLGGVDIVFCCLGAPKQEYFMYENIEKIDCNVMLGLGGSLDVFAGVSKRAPDIFIKLSLEWLYRLLKQPSRFIRMMKLPLYILSAFAYRFKVKKGDL